LTVDTTTVRSALTLADTSDTPLLTIGNTAGIYQVGFPTAASGVAVNGTLTNTSFALRTNGVTRMQIPAAGNVGVGTTSPTKLFSVHGDSLFSGTLTAGNLPATSTRTLPALATPAGSFLAVNASGLVIATSSPAGDSNASTTLLSDVNTFSGATTTFSKSVQIGGTASDNAFHIDCDARNWPVSTSVGGCANITLTGNTGEGFVVWDADGADANGKVVSFRASNSAFDQQVVGITNVGTNAGLNVDCTTTAGIANCVNITSTNVNETPLGVAGAPDDHATLKVAPNRAGTVNTFLYSTAEADDAAFVGGA
jgi:hypothetical protein